MLLQRGLLVWISKPPVNGFRIWASKPGCSFSENGRSTWHHREACIEVKQSHEEHVTFKCTYHKLDHFTPSLVVLPKYLGYVGNV
jgi:hypothetical protein